MYQKRQKRDQLCFSIHLPCKGLREVLKTEGEARCFQHFLHVYGSLFNISKSFQEMLKTMGFAKLLRVHPECVDYVPLNTLKEHPL